MQLLYVLVRLLWTRLSFSPYWRRQWCLSSACVEVSFLVGVNGAAKYTLLHADTASFPLHRCSCVAECRQRLARLKMKLGLLGALFLVSLLEG